jgi:hypothetical protein
MPHRGEEQRGARLVRPDPLRLLACLDHQDTVAVCVAGLERGGSPVELITEYQDQLSAAHG